MTDKTVCDCGLAECPDGATRTVSYVRKWDSKEVLVAEGAASYGLEQRPCEPEQRNRSKVYLIVNKILFKIMQNQTLHNTKLPCIRS